MHVIAKPASTKTLASAGLTALVTLSSSFQSLLNEIICEKTSFLCSCTLMLAGFFPCLQSQCIFKCNAHSLAHKGILC